MGKVTHTPFASVKKKDYEESKYIYQTKVGFRITSMKVSRLLSMYYIFPSRFDKDVKNSHLLLKSALLKLCKNI